MTQPPRPSTSRLYRFLLLRLTNPHPGPTLPDAPTSTCKVVSVPLRLLPVCGSSRTYRPFCLSYTFAGLPSHYRYLRCYLRIYLPTPCRRICFAEPEGLSSEETASSASSGVRRRPLLDPLPGAESRNSSCLRIVLLL
jgi:hypothetical protein